MWWQKHRKSDFYKNKNVLKIDAFKILVSKKEPYGTNKSIKYFIEYNHDDFIRVLCIKLPQMDMLNALKIKIRMIIRMIMIIKLTKQCFSKLLIISY